MTEWKFVVQEVSTYYVELDTSNEEEAFDKVKAMMASGEIDRNDPAYCSIDENIYPI